MRWVQLENEVYTEMKVDNTTCVCKNNVNVLFHRWLIGLYEISAAGTQRFTLRNI